MDEIPDFRYAVVLTLALWLLIIGVLGLYFTWYGLGSLLLGIGIIVILIRKVNSLDL